MGSSVKRRREKAAAERRAGGNAGDGQQAVEAGATEWTPSQSLQEEAAVPTT